MEIVEFVARFQEKVTSAWDISLHTVRRMLSNCGIEASAAIAFFTLFSLFPLMVLFVAGASFLLESREAQDQVLQVVLNYVPSTSRTLIRENINQVLQARGSMGAVGVVGLLWSATGVFNGLMRNLSRAWPKAGARNILKRRAEAVIVVVSLFILLLLLLFTQTVLGFLEGREVIFGVPIFVPELMKFASRVSAYIFTYAVLLLMYRFVPDTWVRWREAAAAAGLAFVGMELLTTGFSMYLSSGAARYNLVYGSIGTLVSFMFWLFGMGFVILLGGYVSSAYALNTRLKNRGEGDMSGSEENGNGTPREKQNENKNRSE
jgi:membrane protein